MTFALHESCYLRVIEKDLICEHVRALVVVLETIPAVFFATAFWGPLLGRFMRWLLQTLLWTFMWWVLWGLLRRFCDQLIQQIVKEELPMVYAMALRWLRQWVWSSVGIGHGSFKGSWENWYDGSKSYNISNQWWQQQHLASISAAMQQAVSKR